MKKKKWDIEAILIAGLLFLLCFGMFFRMSVYYEKFLEGTKLQIPRYQ